MAVRSPSRDRTWPLAEGKRRGRGIPYTLVQDVHGEYSFGLSLGERVIDIITRGTRMRHCRRRRPVLLSASASQSLLSSRLSFRTFLVYCTHNTSSICVYNAADLTNFFIYRLCRKSLPLPSRSLSRFLPSFVLVHFRALPSTPTIP